MASWDLKWEQGAVTMLCELPWREAARVDAAVIRLAETGEGRLEAVTGDPKGFRLRVAPYIVRFDADPEARELRIFAVFTGR